MWRKPVVNLFRRTINSTLRPNFSHSNQFNGDRFPRIGSFYHYCSSAVAVDDNNGEIAANRMTCGEARRLMRLVNVEALKEKLGMYNKEVIPYDELLEACRSLGVAKSSDEAAAFAMVVDLVRKAMQISLLLEDDPCKEELNKLQEQKEEIDMLAHKQVRCVLWTGLGVAVVQGGLFFRLTFWEFSWDVMEPIAFFTTTTGIIVGYAYFMITSRDPTYQDLLKRLFLSRQRKLVKKQNFDIKRYFELEKKFKLYVHSCASIKRRTGVEMEPEDLLTGH